MAAMHAPQPAGRQVLLEAADPVEHVVHPAAGDLLHHGLQLLALAEGVEDRRDRAELQRVGTEEHQVVEHPVELGEQGAGPDRPRWDLHAQQLLCGKHDAELVGEGGEPVVPVGQHDDLAVVADLEELLGAAVHVADDRLGRDDPLAVDDQLEPQDAVRRRVLRPDVEHHVGGGEPRRVGCAPDADAELAGPGPLRHAASLPPATPPCKDRPDGALRPRRRGVAARLAAAGDGSAAALRRDRRSARDRAGGHRGAQ